MLSASTKAGVLTLPILLILLATNCQSKLTRESHIISNERPENLNDVERNLGGVQRQYASFKSIDSDIPRERQSEDENNLHVATPQRYFSAEYNNTLWSGMAEEKTTDKNTATKTQQMSSTVIDGNEQDSTKKYPTRQSSGNESMRQKNDKRRNAKKFNHNVNKFGKVIRPKRAVVNSGFVNLGKSNWGHTEWLGSDREVALRWRMNGGAIVFRAEARAEGHVALAFGNDALLSWLDDDGQPHILDCHMLSGIPMADNSQDYELVFGLRNHTHLVIEFRRPLDTCDPDDIVISPDPVDVQWSVGSGDPRGVGWTGWAGKRSLRLLPSKTPATTPTNNIPTRAPLRQSDFERWEVALKDLVIPENMATMFWCKIFKAPALGVKHHVVGYRPWAGPAARHALLYECAVSTSGDSAQWDAWAAGVGSYGPDMPREWSSCLAPIAAWAVGSKGEMFPDHVGIPLSDPNGVVYYMLEIHYENPSLQKVVDNSGLAILYTSDLRPHDAGILVSGITVSALHVLPAVQKVYRSAGYCSEPCTTVMLPEDGINVVSVLLHSHSAGRKLALRHIRDGQELGKIAEDDHYDYKNQESRLLTEERNVQPGDALVTECTYDTSGRSRPTLGGYSSKQEMCLAFVLHYPRIPLAGCYSMTPVKEFFETFGVREFYGSDMLQVENMFLASGSLEAFPELLDLNSDKNTKESGVQGDDQGVSLLGQLVIKEPPEFRNKTFIAHLNEIPWSEQLLTRRIEDTLYKGTHMTFCRKRDDTLAVPIEIRNFPKFSETTEDPSKQCHYKFQQNGSTTSSSPSISTFIHKILLITIFALFFK